MPSHRRAFAAVLLCASISFRLPAQVSSAITSDPAPDKANPAALVGFQIPSHGALMNAFSYVASGPGPHPVAIVLHGFPGNERNLDLAQAIRRAGWDAVYFDYRGSWGTPGDFSFTHSVEDTDAAIAFLRDPANAKKLRSDPATIVLAGHSMGGFLAIVNGAHDPAIKAVVAISPAVPGATRISLLPPGQRNLTVKGIADSVSALGMAPLAGCTPDSLAHDAIDNAGKWDFAAQAPLLATRPVLLIGSDDGLTLASDALAEALRKTPGARISTAHFPTDHSYSDHRIALEQTVLDFLATVKQK